MWRLSPEMLSGRPHIETISGWTQPLHGDHPIWQRLRATITAIDNREPVIGRIERPDGNVVDCATMPLPDGATLVTFQDVTDTVNVERALRERNEALETADKLKIDFVHHVSYELRSPLTNIIGFAHFLGDPVTGPLTEKQREYLSYITVSTNALLAIINNILDLATIDAGAMTLNLGSVDIRKTMEAAAEGVQDRLVKNGIRLEIRAAPDIGSFVADERRVRQSLFNLLANAVGFSPAGEIVTFAAQRLRDAVVFSVTDRGPGIPADVQDKVFDWFETHSLGSRHRGTGPRPLPGALLRGAARRVGDARIGGRPRHHGHLRVPARAQGRAHGGVMRAAALCPKAAGHPVSAARLPKHARTALIVHGQLDRAATRLMTAGWDRAGSPRLRTIAWRCR